MEASAAASLGQGRQASLLGVELTSIVLERAALSVLEHAAAGIGELALELGPGSSFTYQLAAEPRRRAGEILEQAPRRRGQGVEPELDGNALGAREAVVGTSRARHHDLKDLGIDLAATDAAAGGCDGAIELDVGHGVSMTDDRWLRKGAALSEAKGCAGPRP